MSKSGKDGAGKGAGKAAGGAGGNQGPPPSCALKFLAPDVVASALIGKGGANIAAMRTSCSARLALTEQGEVYPGTDCRVFTVQADTEENLNKVIAQLVARVGDVAKSTAGSPEAVGQEGELKVQILVPRAAVGGLIGKGGANIKELREKTSAVISILEPNGQGAKADQLVTISGTPKALETVLAEVNTQIQSLSGESWFQGWATTAGTISQSYGGGYGGGGYGGGYASGVDIMMNTARQMPPYVMEDARGFAMSCVVPDRLVGGLIGRGGTGTKEVQNMTGTKISIREIPDDPDNRSLNINGPLANTCAAYMMMMRRYLDAEAQASSSGGR